MAYNNWGFTNLANLNFDWILRKLKDVITVSANAETKANTAIATANEANERTLTYASQIAGAVSDADEALELAQDAQDILVIYPDNEGKPVDYKKYMNGETVYIGSEEILTEILLNKKIPFFMDRSQNIFVLNGAIDSGTANTKIKFYRVEDGVFTFAVIDRNQTIAYSYSDSGFVPLSSIDDSGKMLTVGSNGVPGWEEAADGGFVPLSSISDSGKVLTVGSNGVPGWVTPSGGGGGTAVQEIVWGYQDEDSGNSVIRRKSDNTIYTAPQMFTDYSSGKTVMIESPNGIFYLSAVGSLIASFFNGGTLTMIVANDGQFTEVAVASVPIPEITNTGTQLQVTIDPNKFYVFPNAEELDISFGTETSGKVNEFHFRFTSGSTATQLSLPASVNIPDDFDVVANTVYEISIVDNYMVYSSWAVTV